MLLYVLYLLYLVLSTLNPQASASVLFRKDITLMLPAKIGKRQSGCYDGYNMCDSGGCCPIGTVCDNVNLNCLSSSCTGTPCGYDGSCCDSTQSCSNNICVDIYPTDSYTPDPSPDPSPDSTPNSAPIPTSGSGDTSGPTPSSSSSASSDSSSKSGFDGWSVAGKVGLILGIIASVATVIGTIIACNRWVEFPFSVFYFCFYIFNTKKPRSPHARYSMEGPSDRQSLFIARAGWKGVTCT